MIIPTEPAGRQRQDGEHRQQSVVGTVSGVVLRVVDQTPAMYLI